MYLNKTQSAEEYVGQGKNPNRRIKRFADYYDPVTRATRSHSNEYFVEIMVVADKKMAEYHGDGLYHYILTLMSIVSKHFTQLFLFCIHNVICNFLKGKITLSEMLVHK